MTKPNESGNIDQLIESLRADRLMGRGIFQGIEDRQDKKDASKHYYTLKIGKIGSSLDIVLHRDQYLEMRQKTTNNELRLGAYLQYTCEVSVNVSVREWNSADGRSGALVDNSLSQPKLVEYKL